MRSPRLAALELRRFGRGRLPRAAMVAMVLLPLLYGALYLWSFWNPYERLDKIPVAVVNEDRGAQVGGATGEEASQAKAGQQKAERLRAGDSIVEGLDESDTFDWQHTDAKDAREGVEEGRYYLSLTVPSDFSERVASSSGDSPQTGALKVRTNDANNYIVGQISRTVFSEVRAAASSEATSGFFDRIYLSFSTLHSETAKAAKGADDLGDGIGRAKSGAKEIEEGLGDAKDGSGDLKSGTQRLHSGSGKLKKGAGQVANGTDRLAKKVNGVAEKVRPILDEHGDDIGATARGVARTSEALRENLEKLPKDAERAEREARESADFLESFHASRCEGTSEPDEHCPEFEKAAKAAAKTADVAEDVNDAVQNYRDFDKLDRQLGQLQNTAELVADRAPTLGDDVRTAVAQINKLNKGAQQVSSGATELHGGISSAKDGASELDSGIGQLGDGAETLNGGMVKLADGSGKLAGGLHDGAKKIPDYDASEREDRSGVMADPVELDSSKTHAAPNYGTGFAPYFIPLALWVGAMIAYMLLQPLNRRALAAGAPAWRITLAGWLPVAAIGTLQAGALMSVLHWGLGLQLARGVGTVAFLLLVTACFTAIVQFLNARFGPAGRILVLAMLMLQLTSAGGTYPIQTSPEFFNALHPLLPMSYVVEGLRHLITGGDLWPVWRACAVLLAFTLAALALTAVSARRKQVWTVDRLHPEIAL